VEIAELAAELSDVAGGDTVFAGGVITLMLCDLQLVVA
jgi:hypothetical protein